MTNHERYRRAFSTLHASETEWMEESHMQKTGKRYLPRAVAICAVVVLVVALAGMAYAADLGGVQRTVQIWLHGEMTDAVLDVQDGAYTLTYEGADGTTHEQSGGGVAMDGLGGERPLTAEELMEQLNAPDVEYADDGSVWLYYKNQKLDITDRFDDDGLCHVKLQDGDQTLYLTVKYQNGYAYSNERYLFGWEFN